MSRHTGPRAGSAAHKVICRLVDLGGTAKMSVLMEVLSAEYRRMYVFKDKVANVLHGFDFVTFDGASLKATQKGKEYAADLHSTYLPLATKYVGQIVPPRALPKNKPLNLSHIYPPTVVREGAFDHQTIPSMMGGKRVMPGGGGVVE